MLYLKKKNADPFEEGKCRRGRCARRSSVHFLDSEIDENSDVIDEFELFFKNSLLFGKSLKSRIFMVFENLSRILVLAPKYRTIRESLVR